MQTHFYPFLFLALAAGLCAADETDPIQWGPQTNSVKMAIMVMAPQTLTEADVVNMPELIEQIKRNANALSNSDVLSSELWRNLSTNEQLLLTN